MRRFTDFILYNNTFTLVMGFLLLGGGTALANEDVREAVASTVIATEERVQQIDNSLILNADIENYDFEMLVTGVSEDEWTYYVTYSYRTLEVHDGEWQEVQKEDTLTVQKSELRDWDFETYVTKQLAEIVAAQRMLLAETQSIEATIGQRGKVVERSYSGLVGRFLDPDVVIVDPRDAHAHDQATTTDTDVTDDTNPATTTPQDNDTGTTTATTTPPDQGTGTTTATTTPADDGSTTPGDGGTDPNDGTNPPPQDPDPEPLPPPDPDPEPVDPPTPPADDPPPQPAT